MNIRQTSTKSQPNNNYNYNIVTLRLAKMPAGQSIVVAALFSSCHDDDDDDERYTHGSGSGCERKADGQQKKIVKIHQNTK